MAAIGLIVWRKRVVGRIQASRTTMECVSGRLYEVHTHTIHAIQQVIPYSKPYSNTAKKAAVCCCMAAIQLPALLVFAAVKYSIQQLFPYSSHTAYSSRGHPSDVVLLLVAFRFPFSGTRESRAAAGAGAAGPRAAARGAVPADRRTGRRGGAP